MKTELIIAKLNDKCIAMQAENRKYDGRHRLCRTTYFSHHRTTMANIKKMAAINISIKILLGETITLNEIEQLYSDCFPPCDKAYDIENNFRRNSPYYKPLAWVLENSINKYLPAFKKNVFKQPFYFVHDSRITNINDKQTDYGRSVGFWNISITEYMVKIKSFHHTFCKMDDYNVNMKPILLSCCGRFNLKANDLNFEKLLDAATLGVIHKDIQELINKSEG